MKRVLRDGAQVCIKLNLMTGNVLFVDGSKIRANAGRDNSYKQDYYEKLLVDIDRRIDQLLTDCESADQQEEGAGSDTSMDVELTKTPELEGADQEYPRCFHNK